MKYLRHFIAVIFVLQLSIHDTVKSQVLNFNYPDYGDTVIYENITPAVPIDLNTTGTSLSWNFSPTMVWYKDTVFFKDPSQSSYFSFFPEATVQYDVTPGNWLNAEGFTFLKQTVDNIFLVGNVFPAETGSNILIPVVAIDPLKLFELPVQLGSAFSDTGIAIGYANGTDVGLPYDSIHVRSYVYRYDTIDSKGTLVLTDRNYPDVLRKKSTETGIDSLFYFDSNNSEWIFGTVMENHNNIQYTWLGDSTDFILAGLSVRNDTIEQIQVVPQTFVPDPYIQLVFENLADTVVSGLTVPAFQVKAMLYPDSTVLTSFNGPVSLSFFQGSQITLNNSVTAINGVAYFNSTYFSGLGNDVLYAWADTFLAAHQSIHLLPQPPPSIYLEFNGMPDTIFENNQFSFQVIAKKIVDGTIATTFEDSVRLGQDISTGVSINSLPAVKAINGIADFSNIFFAGGGLAEIWAFADTTRADTTYTQVYKKPYRFEFVNTSVLSYEQTVAPEIHVNVKDIDNNQSYAYNDTIRIGKISGPGNVLGTLKRKAFNGHAVFDDLIFSYPGTYQLLTFPNKDLNYPIILDDTITINVSAYPWYQWTFSHTDTLSEFVDRSTFWFWEANADGFLSGTSRDWYSEVAQRFDFTGKAKLTKVIMYFAGYTQVNSTSDDYKLKIYNSGVQSKSVMPSHIDSLPLEFLGEQVFNAADIEMGDFYIRQPTVITFDNPVDITSDFHIALEGNNSLADDTLILWNSIPGNGMGERRTSRYAVSYGNNEPFWVLDHYFRPTFDVDFMMMPVLEIDTSDFVTEQNELALSDFGITIYPNPGYGIFNFNAINAIQEIEITDLSGRLIFANTFSLNSNSVVVSLEYLSSGLYNAQIYLRNGTAVKEKLVILKP
ncbi:MAG: hypothetical protein POELPBGB_01045 [Bacteroidia bacterium]|nr:hypothetical protein [Bacteroidia bacterium]